METRTTEEELSPYSVFAYAVRSSLTREYYLRRLRAFFDFLGFEPQKTIEERCNFYAKLGRENDNWSFNNVLKFLQFQKERVESGEITGATLRNYVKAIKLFCEMADILISWKKITRGLPRVRRYANDRAPTIEEIRKIGEYPDRRIKGVIYTMASSGIRLGAWDFLRWGHIQPIERNGKIVAAKVIVYAEDEDEYFTFITPEAFKELEKWMSYRSECGETINQRSWVMRHMWNTKRGYTHGLISAPKKLRSPGIKRLMEDALWTQGLRRKLEADKRRHEFQTDHGLRKWFKTRCELSGMKSINIEILMSHSIGVSDSYYRITEEELLQEYLKAVDFLTVNSAEKLKSKVEKLESHISDMKTVEFQLDVKSNEIRVMKERYEKDMKAIREEMENKFQHILSRIDMGKLS